MAYFNLADYLCMAITRLLPLLLALFVLPGCASHEPRQPTGWAIATERPAAAEAGSWYSPFSWFDSEPAQDEEAESDVPAEQIPEEADYALDLKGLLYAQLREWHAVRYQLGGTSKRGVDCSGYVYLTYRDKLGIELPRVVREQSGAGRTITQAELEPGDLVFFQVDRRTRHVGIYLEDRKFMHASFSKGVTISSLDNRYWSKRYWKAVRVPEALLAMRMN